MKKLAWLIALYAPLAMAAPKISKELSAKLEVANKKVSSLLVNDKNQEAISAIDELLKEIPADTDPKALKQDKNYTKLLQAKGDALIADGSYDAAVAFYNELCKDLKGNALKTCMKPTKVVDDIRGTTIEFAVANKGPRTEIFFSGKAESYCFLSDDTSLEKDPKHCKNKTKIKARPNPYKGTIKREGFNDEKFSVVVALNKANKATAEGGAGFVLKEKPAKLVVAPYPANALISIDGQDATTSTALTPGEHTITVSAKGYTKKEEKIKCTEGKIIIGEKTLGADEQLSVKLVPVISFVFEAPKEINIYNGETLINSQIKNGELEVPEGTNMSLVAKASGYKDFDISLPNPMEPGKEIKLTLEPNNSVFVKVKVPAGAKLFINKREVDPSKEFILDPGIASYTVSVQQPGYLPFEQVVALKPNQQVNVTVEELAKDKPSILRPVGIAVGGAGVISSGVFGVLALQQRTKIEGTADEVGLAQRECVLSNRPDLEALPPDQVSSVCQGNTNQKEFFDASKKRKTMALASDVGLTMAAVGGSLFVVSLLTKPISKGDVKTTPLAIQLSPNSIQLSGSF
jgi:hypothetical protein